MLPARLGTKPSELGIGKKKKEEEKEKDEHKKEKEEEEEEKEEKEVEKGVDVPMKYSRLLLRWHHMMPPEGQEDRPGLAYLVRFSVATAAALGLLGLILFSTGKAVQAGAWELMNEFLAYALSLGGCLYMYGVHALICRHSLAAQRRLLDFGRFGRPACLRGACRRLNRLVALGCGYVFLCLTSHAFYSLLSGDCQTEHRQRQGLQVWCGYIKLMIERDASSLVEVVVVSLYEFLACVFVVQGAGVCAGNFFETTAYITIKVDHLNGMLEAMFDPEHEGRYGERFAECARYFSHLHNVSKDLNRYYKMTTFVHLLLAGVVFALMANLIIQNHRISDLFHLSGWIFFFSLSCFGGQLTINASERTCIAIYNSRWYEMDASLQKDVLFLLRLAQKPIIMEAGWFGILSFPLLASVINTSYSYLTLMQSSKR